MSIHSALVFCRVTGMMTSMIVSRFVGVDLNIGIFVGAGGVLSCSLLAGMRRVPWRQVAHYAILATAYLVPLVVLGSRPGHEIEYPLAVVILGGLLTSTLLNLFVTALAVIVVHELKA